MNGLNSQPPLLPILTLAMCFRALAAVAKCAGLAREPANRVACVIHFNRLAGGDIVLLLIYAKSARDSIGADVLRKIVKEL